MGQADTHAQIAYFDDASGQVSLFAVAKQAQKGHGAQCGESDCVWSDAQRTALQSTARVTVVNGSAGTGKTCLLAARIVHMITACSVRASQIIAVTPTAYAAEELTRQVAHALGGKRHMRGIKIGTLEMITLAKRHARGQPGTWLDVEQCRILAQQTVREIGWQASADDFLRAVCALKNGVSEEVAGLLQEQAALYDWKMRASDAIDGDELLLDELEHAQKVKKKEWHVLVDAFEDLGDTAYRLVRAWSETGTLFVLGDPNQALCPYPGAPSDNFDRLLRAEPSLARITLAHSHRVAADILTHAGKEQEQARESIRVVHVASPMDEVSFVARDIAHQVGGVERARERRASCEFARAFGEIAVLCRTDKQLERLKRTLTHAGILCAAINEPHTDAVTLATIAEAKGAQFGVVYLCGVTGDNLLPQGYAQTVDMRVQWRVFYIGMTRACDALVVVSQPPTSPFIEMLPVDAYVCEGLAVSDKNTGTQLSLF